MVNTGTEIKLKWYGYPIRFYIDKLEFPWFVFVIILILIYVWSFSVPLSYLGFLAPLSLISEIVTLVVAIYLLINKLDLSLPVVLVYGGSLGFVIGLVSSLLAFLRFWYIWLFFNIVVESIVTAIFGLLAAFIIFYIRRLLCWLKTSKSNNEEQKGIQKPQVKI